jgi:hypothetical protein
MILRQVWTIKLIDLQYKVDLKHIDNIDYFLKLNKLFNIAAILTI